MYDYTHARKLDVLAVLLGRLEFWGGWFVVVGVRRRVRIAHALLRLGVHTRFEFVLELAHALFEFDEASAERSCYRRQAVAEEQNGNDAEDEPMHHAETTHCNLLLPIGFAAVALRQRAANTAINLFNFADGRRLTIGRVLYIPF